MGNLASGHTNKRDAEIEVRFSHSIKLSAYHLVPTSPPSEYELAVGELGSSADKDRFRLLERDCFSDVEYERG